MYLDEETRKKYDEEMEKIRGDTIGYKERKIILKR